MLREKSPQVTAGHAEPIGEIFNRTFIKGAIGDKAKATTNRCGCATPRRSSGRTFWSTTQARPQTSL
ncbi:MAG: hypothetical protein OEM99_09525 [Gammaproteobacteria bacterium]|nr:hypothetical protein [Gammaproteobacteria bacterium]